MATDASILDAVADRFREALRAARTGDEPTFCLERHLDAGVQQHGEALRQPLFQALLPVELHMRRTVWGDSPTPEEYYDRFPEFRDVIDEVLKEQDMANQTVQPQDSFASPRETGRFRIVRHHKDGGLGRVSIAIDLELDREVAFKEIKPEFAHDPQDQARFVLEGEVTGKLEHPGIVPVYGLGQFRDGRPFYAMRFIRGQSLHDAIEQFHRARPASGLAYHLDSEFRHLVGRLIDVCQAIEYAHSKGVLHRDLKPQNVMLGKYGETLVVDWGLAKLRAVSLGDAVPADTSRDSNESVIRVSADSGSAPTQMGDAMGTPRYMSPEQALGQIDKLSHGTDVYALGAMLFSVLTNQAPIGARPLPDGPEKLDPREALRRASEGRFPRPTTLNSAVPRSLEAACLKAMSFNVENRYLTAKLFADDLQAWLDDKPVSACPEPFTVHARRWMQQHRAAVATTAATFFMSFLGLLGWGLLSAQHAREVETKNTKLRDTNTQLAQANTKEREATQRAAERAAENAKLAEQEKTARKKAERQAHIARVRHLVTQSKSAREAKPQLSLLLAIEAVGSSLRRKEVPSHLEIGELRQSLSIVGGIPLNAADSPVIEVAASPDSHWVATGHGDGSLYLWNLQEPMQLFTPTKLTGHSTGIVRLQFSPSGQWLVSASGDDTTRVWDLRAPKADFPCTILSEGRPITTTRLDFTPDGRFLATASRDGTIHVWDLAAPHQDVSFSKLTGLTESLDKLKFTKDGKWLVAQAFRPSRSEASIDFTRFNPEIRIWRVSATDRKWAGFVLRHPDDTSTFALSPNSRWLSTGCHDSIARLWDLLLDDPSLSPVELKKRVPRPAFGSNQQREYVRDIHFSADSGAIVVKTGFPAKGQAWRLPQGQPPEHLFPVEAPWLGGVGQVEISPNARWLAVAAGPGETLRELGWSKDRKADYDVRIWGLLDTPANSQPRTLMGHNAFVSALTWSADSRWVATGCEDGVVRLWELTTNESFGKAIELRGHQGSISWLKFSDNGHWLVSAGYDGIARRWDMRGKDIAAASITFRAHESRFKSAIVTSDSRWLVTRPELGKTDPPRLWDMNVIRPGSSPISIPAGDGHAIRPDGETLATITGRAITLFDLRSEQPQWTGTPLGEQSKNADNPSAEVTFSPDGRWLAATVETTSIFGARLGAVHLWDLNQPAESRKPFILRGHSGYIAELCFSPDGTRLITGSGDETARVWNLAASDPSKSPTVLRGHKSSVVEILVSHNGRWGVTRGIDDKGYFAWDLLLKQPASTLIPGDSHKASISEDSQWLVTSDRGVVRLWNLKLGGFSAPPTVIETGAIFVVTILIDRSSNWLAIHGRKLTKSGDENEVQLYSLQPPDSVTGGLILTSKSDVYGPIGFSPNGRWFGWRKDKSPRLLDLKSLVVNPSATSVQLPIPAAIGKPHLEFSPRLEFSPDSRWLVAGGLNSPLGIWDLEGDMQPTDVVELASESLNPGNQRWIITEDRGTILLFPNSLEAMLKTARRTAGRGFLDSERDQFVDIE